MAQSRQNITPQGLPAVICPCSASEKILLRRQIEKNIEKFYLNELEKKI